MLMVGADFINTSGSFDTLMRADEGGKLYVKTYATSGMSLKTPVMLNFRGSGFAATAVGASMYGYVGVPEIAIASGCVGWAQIRGFTSNVQAASTSEWTGSVGHAIYPLATTFGLGATTSAYVGNQDIGQCGVLMTSTYNASTTANIFLTGAWCTTIA